MSRDSYQRATEPPSYFTFSRQVPSSHYPETPSSIESPQDNSQYGAPTSPRSQRGSTSDYSISSSIHDLVTNNAEMPDLPSYSIGANIQPVTTQNALATMLKVSITNPKPTYDIGDFIYGTMTFAPRKEVEIDRIFAVLEGEETTVKSTWSADVFTRRKMNLAFHVVPQTALPLDMKAKPGFLYSFPFAIQIPGSQPPQPKCSTNTPEHKRLPPSLGSPAEHAIPLNNLPGNVARVTYRIRATVKTQEPRTGKSVEHCHGLSFIHITPSYSLTPAALERVHKQPRSSYLESKKNLLKKSSKGALELKLPEIPALPLFSTHTTRIPLLISFMPTTEAGLNAPPQVSQITTKLNSRTLYSTEVEFPTSPASESPSNSISKVHQSFPLNKLSPAATPWELDIAKAAQAGVKTAYTSLFHLPVLLQWNKLLTPTFESCFVARDYTIEVKVSFQDKSSISISVPINIVASMAPKSNFPNEVSSSRSDSISYPNWDQASTYPPSLSSTHYSSASSSSGSYVGHYSSSLAYSGRGINSHLIEKAC